VIGYSGSSLVSYISGYGIAGQTINGVTTFDSPLLLKSGVTNYHGDDEDPSGMFGSPTSRWGDYSATTVDPSDPNRFWTIQIYASDSNGWSTQITELVTTPQVLLSMAPAGTNVVLSWPVAFSDYRLQSANDVVSPGWTNVSQGTLTNAGQVSVVMPVSGGKQFFRLQKM